MSGWTTVRLEDCAEIVSGATPSTSESTYWDGDICWATPKDLSELEGAYISDTPRKITRSGLQSCAATVLPPDSVLFSSRAPIGHVAINTVPMATNQGFKSFVPNRERVHAKFLYHWLRRNRPYLESLGNGATFKEVSKAVVARIEIPLPPLPEQRRIAAILDKADALRAKRRAALAQLDTLTQSIFLDMFGDPATNPKGWPREPLTSACHCYSGGTPAKENPGNWTGSIPWFSPKDLKQHDLFDSEDHINDSIPSTTSLRLLPADTVAIVVRGMILAHTFPVSVLRIPATVNQDLKALLPRRPIDAQFLAHCLRVQSVRALGYVSESAHGTKRLDADGLEKLYVLHAPMELQHRFAELVKRSEQALSALGMSHAGLDALFASLQHRAFRGEL
jgi:type I restriction enzyme S subunit